MSGAGDGSAGYGPAGAEESLRANRRWWDAEASDYLGSHGDFLGEADFVWGPEGLREADAALLGPLPHLAGRRVLEVGAGAGQCSRWLARHGVRSVALDVSAGMLGALPPADRSPILVQADARRLPFASASFDAAFSAYGAVPFVADPERIMAEVARILRPGGRWVFSITHPIRWAFPDDPGPAGLTATKSYFDLRPYAERDAAGRLVYAEHHRTLGDRVRDLVAAGLELLDLVEPTWPAGHDRTWGGWSPLRGRLLPGTAIFVTRRPPVTASGPRVTASGPQ